MLVGGSSRQARVWKRSQVTANAVLGYSGQNFVGIAALRRVQGNGRDHVVVDLAEETHLSLYAFPGTRSAILEYGPPG
jgi:hypothetical protein